MNRKKELETQSKWLKTHKTTKVKKSQNMAKVYCTNCRWKGNAFELVDFVKCPKCKQGKYIEDSWPERDEPLWKYQNGFNWNKI